MSVWTTRARAAAPSGAQVSPSLLFHKWHDYDLGEQSRRSLDTKGSRVRFLEKVAQEVDRVLREPSSPYSAWHERYKAALAALGVEERLGYLEAPTVWRLVMGFGSNPALEAGLHLHPLLGFPYLPGSAARGLAHHVAEMTLGEQERLAWKDLAHYGEKGEGSHRKIRERLKERAAEVAAFLEECVKVRDLFGSVHVVTQNQPEAEDEVLPSTPRDLLERWRKALQGELSQDERDLLKAITALLDEPHGGRLVFYDAVPKPGQSGLLQVDILNPHYPEYYRDPARHPPSDDQDPNPFYFLAVAPNKTFEFRFRWKPFREDGETKGKDEEAKKQEAKRQEGLASARRWLAAGLADWGAGGKTAAGYGYFAIEEASSGVD